MFCLQSGVTLLVHTTEVFTHRCKVDVPQTLDRAICKALCRFTSHNLTPRPIIQSESKRFVNRACSAFLLICRVSSTNPLRRSSGGDCYAIVFRCVLLQSSQGTKHRISASANIWFSSFTPCLIQNPNHGRNLYNEAVGGSCLFQSALVGARLDPVCSYTSPIYLMCQENILFCSVPIYLLNILQESILKYIQNVTKSRFCKHF